MVKRIILFTAFTFSLVWAPCIFAQERPVSIGVRGGISIPNLTGGKDNPVSRGYSSKLGANIAAYVEIPFTETFSLISGLTYSEQGGKKSGKQAFPVTDEDAGMDLSQFLPDRLKADEGYRIYADVKSKASLNYLMLPIMARFGWDFHFTKQVSSPNHFRAYVQAGPFFGLMLNAHQKLSHTETGIFDSDQDDAENLLGEGGTLDFSSFVDPNIDTYDDLHHFNMGIIGGVGLAYHFHKNAVFIEGGGDYGFLNVQKNTDKDGKNNTGSAYVGIGYSRDF